MVGRPRLAGREERRTNAGVPAAFHESSPTLMCTPLQCPSPDPRSSPAASLPAPALHGFLAFHTYPAPSPHPCSPQVSAEDKAVRMAELAAERSQQLAELARLLGRRRE